MNWDSNWDTINYPAVLIAQTSSSTKQWHKKEIPKERESVWERGAKNEENVKRKISNEVWLVSTKDFVLSLFVPILKSIVQWANTNLNLLDDVLEASLFK